MTISCMFSVEPVAARLLIWRGTLIKRLKIELCGHIQYAVVLMGFSCIETLVHAYQTRVCALPRETTVAGGRINKTKRKKERIKRQMYLQRQEPSKMGVYNIYTYIF